MTAPSRIQPAPHSRTPTRPSTPSRPTAPAHRRPRQPPTEARDQGSLRVVPPPRPHAPAAPFVAVVSALLVAGLLGLLGLNTALAEDAVDLHKLRTEERVLADQEQQLHGVVEEMSAPGALSTRARELGMVQGGPAGWIDLSTGAVLGQPRPAAAPTAPPPHDGER